jgi:hypothetical protein
MDWRLMRARQPGECRHYNRRRAVRNAVRSRFCGALEGSAPPNSESGAAGTITNSVGVSTAFAV